MLVSCGGGGGSGGDNNDSFPNVPKNLTAIAEYTKVNLNWDVVSSATYDVYYAKETFSGVNIANYASLNDGTLLQNIATITKEITSLTNNTQYYFVVTANKDTFESDKSNEVTAIPRIIITINFNGKEYREITNSTTSKTWLDRNLGASRVANSATDSKAYGDLYQWGRPKDGHQLRTSGTDTIQVATITPNHNKFIYRSEDWSTIDSSGALRSLFMAKTDGTGLCPLGFRMPTDTELNAERLSWSSNNSAGAYASPLKWLATGYLDYINASLDGVARGRGFYWSSTANGSYGRNLYLNSSNADVSSFYRADGFAVRCIKD